MVRADARAFLQMAYEPDDWIAIFLRHYGTGDTAQRVIPLAAALADRFQAWLRARNAQGSNVYVSVNTFTPGQRTRRRQAVRAVRHVFLDVDTAAETVRTAIRRRDDLPPPSYVLRSSPDRIHILWRVRGFDADGAERLQRHLSRELGTDMAATSSTQTTRIPGFFNHKYVPACEVAAEIREPNHRYAPIDFPPVPPNPAPPPRAPWRPARTGDANARERAARYLAALPPAVAGQYGDRHTFRVCCRLARGFALSDEDALAVLMAWNARCEPPWRERELAAKLQHARVYGREPVGGLLETQPWNGRPG